MPCQQCLAQTTQGIVYFHYVCNVCTMDLNSLLMIRIPHTHTHTYVHHMTDHAVDLWPRGGAAPAGLGGRPELPVPTAQLWATGEAPIGRRGAPLGANLSHEGEGATGTDSGGTESRVSPPQAGHLWARATEGEPSLPILKQWQHNQQPQVSSTSVMIMQHLLACYVHYTCICLICICLAFYMEVH